MRKQLGWGVLIVGVGALGYLAPTTHATGIQNAILLGARDIAGATDAPLDVQVSGRDVTVTGTVMDGAALADLTSQFETVDGLRVLDVSAVATWPVADPFALTATRAPDGTRHVSGVVPTRDAMGDFGPDVTLAAGAPDGAWLGVVQTGLGALDSLTQGSFAIVDRDITLSGTAITPLERDAAMARLNDLPAGYAATFDIDVLDDGTPLRLDVTLRDGAIAAMGKLPSGMSGADIEAIFAQATIDVIRSALPATDPAWPDGAQTAMRALNALIDGQLTFEGNTLTLSGSGSLDGTASAGALLGTLPNTFAVNSDIGLWDDGRPNTLTMTWDGRTATADGKFPANFAPRGPAGTAVDNTGEQSFLDDTSGVFTANADAGTTALGLMTDGRLIVSDSTITLSGTAASPQVGDVIDSVFADITADITRDITFLDDGSPAAWTLSYDAQTGGRVDGRLPNGLTQGDIAATLGLANLSGTVVTAPDDPDLGSSVDVLTIVATYLPEVEALTYTRDAGGSALDLTVSPGVDIDVVAVDLAERLPVDVAFSLSPLDPLPDAGTTRLNTLTGLEEEFRNGFWIPTLAFTPDIAGCSAQADAVFDRASITFFSSSAQLDATSIRAINALAAVVQPCLDAGLTLEIGGHTDATGSELSNEVLSGNRANAVRDALAQRGVPTDAMTTFGYGQSEPVADNSTPEGRAANRRTSLTWANP